MKNKKGFTLVELIVTIALISVIGTIIAVNMVGIYKKQDQKEIKRAKSAIIAAAEAWVNNNDVNVNNKCLKIEDLINDGYLKESQLPELYRSTASVLVNSSEGTYEVAINDNQCSSFIADSDKKTYQLEYKFKDAANSSSFTTIGYNAQFTIPTKSRDGYTLKGFSENKNATKVDYEVGKNYTYKWKRNKTLYAVWEQDIQLAINWDFISSIKIGSKTYSNTSTNISVSKSELPKTITIKKKSGITRDVYFNNKKITEAGTAVTINYGMISNNKIDIKPYIEYSFYYPKSTEIAQFDKVGGCTNCAAGGSIEQTINNTEYYSKKIKAFKENTTANIVFKFNGSPHVDMTSNITGAGKNLSVNFKMANTGDDFDNYRVAYYYEFKFANAKSNVTYEDNTIAGGTIDKSNDDYIAHIYDPSKFSVKFNFTYDEKVHESTETSIDWSESDTYYIINFTPAPFDNVVYTSSSEEHTGSYICNGCDHGRNVWVYETWVNLTGSVTYTKYTKNEDSSLDLDVKETGSDWHSGGNGSEDTYIPGDGSYSWDGHSGQWLPNSD